VDRRTFLVGAAGLVLAPRALAKTAPLALVTADLESRLVALDLHSGRVVGEIETQPFPRSIETVGGGAVVAHSDFGVVSIVDGLRRVRVVRGFAEPRYTAADPRGRYAYVTDAARGEVVVVDVVRAAIVRRVRVGDRARHLSLHVDTLWVALGSKAERVAVVRGGQVETFAPPFLAHDVGLAPDGRHAWVTSGDREQIAIYDRGRLVRTIDADWPPQHLTFAGDRVYVTSGWSGTLRVHDVKGRLLARNPLPVGSYNVQHADGRVLTPALGHGNLTVADEQGRILWSRKVARSSHDACVI
jgi:DNA-binding beta-propeller fold protein YncE